jgi:hypothetical protein
MRLLEFHSTNGVLCMPIDSQKGRVHNSKDGQERSRAEGCVCYAGLVTLYTE